MKPNRQLVNLISDKGERFCYYHSDDFRLGKGAMGEVFKGWYADFPNHKVAIKKVYNQHAEQPNIRNRARYEASLCIDHPNIVKMLGYCAFDELKGPIYIVCELVRGTTINKFVATIDPAMRVVVISRMMCAVLDALTCLHNQDPPVIHRDIKPSNIMVENGMNVRLMDLGIATSDGVHFGTLDGFVGTAAYTSPEQISNARFGKVSPASDVYSLGVIFYELLTGNNPFSEGTSSEVDILEKQVSNPLPHHPQLPKKLYQVLLKATAKAPSKRFRRAADFKQAIFEALEEGTESRRVPWLLIVSIVCLAAVLTFIGLILANS